VTEGGLALVDGDVPVEISSDDARLEVSNELDTPAEKVG
jgi:hypothetical protein